MIRKLHFILALQLFLMNSVYAQSVTKISGSITDKAGTPLEFVNVMLLHAADSTLVKGVVSDVQGKYELEADSTGSYRMMFSQVGYEKFYTPVFEIKGDQATMDLGVSAMPDNVTTLKGVDVVAKKSFIERHPDKTVVNVENSIVDAGSTAMEVLQKSPGVSVDNNDNISLKGKSGVMILIDGKSTYLSTQDLAVLLKSMSSEQVSKIEIMTTPPAKYDAAGNAGVINIVLRKDKRMGANGNIRGSFGQGKTPDAGAGISLNYRQNKTNVYGNYDYDWRKSLEDLYIKRNFSENGTITSIFTQNSDIDYLGKTHRFKVGVDYDINQNNTVGILLSGMNSNNSHNGKNTTEISNGEGVMQSDAVTVNDANSEWTDYYVNANWLHKFDTVGTRLTVDLDFSKYDQTGVQFFTSSETDFGTGVVTNEELRNNTPSTVEIKSFKSDFEHPFSEQTKLEAGIKTSYVITDNNVEYFNIEDQVEIIDTSRTNHFKYTENINAGYVSLHTKYRKLGVQAGLRVEQTIATGEQLTLDSTFKRNYTQFFPTLYLEHALGENNQLNFAFSRRLDRPSYRDLNPFRYYLDQYTFQQGNSLLEPQYSYNFELTETFKGTYSLTVNYSITDDVITQVTKQIDSIYTTYLTKENLDQLENYGIALSIPVQIYKWWNSNNYINVYVNHYKGEFEGGQLNMKSTAFNINSNQSFQLPKNWSLELSGWYQSEGYYGIIRMEPMWSVNFGIEKKMLDERLSVKAIVNDIFYKSAFSGSTKYMNQDYEIHSADDTRYVRFFCTYRFGKKTVQQARRRSTGVEEERNRIDKN